MKNIFFLSLLMIALGVDAQQKVINDARAVTRQVSGYHAIQISDGIDLYLTQSDAEAVAVSAVKDEYRDKIVTEVSNGVLKIYYGNNTWPGLNWRINRKLKAYVSFKSLDRLNAWAGSDVKVNGTIQVEKLKLKISSGSDFTGRVEVKELEVDQSSGADVKISGTATNLRIEAGSGSDFRGYDLVTEYCYASGSSGSDINITVNKEFIARASSGSDVSYRGTAVIREKHSSGGGSVQRSGQ